MLLFCTSDSKTKYGKELRLQLCFIISSSALSPPFSLVHIEK